MDFLSKFYSGYTLLPNFLIKMRMDGEITRNEFELLHIIYAHRNFHNHKTSSRQIAKMITGIKHETISACLKSLESKKILRVVKVDSHYHRIDIMLREKLIIEKSDEPEFSIGGGALEDFDDAERGAPEDQGWRSRGPTGGAPEGHIELSKKELNKNKEGGSISGQKGLPSPSSVLDLWNGKAGGKLPLGKGITPKRRIQINKLSQTFKTLEAWALFFDTILNSNFLTGTNNRGWRANFDWIVNESNAIKIQEGNYDNKSKNLDHLFDFFKSEGNDVEPRTLSERGTKAP